jgi:hypothetical protein
MQAKAPYTRRPDIVEVDGETYTVLKEDVADDVQEWLEKRDKEVVEWVVLLAGGLITLASPFLLVKIKELDILWLFVIGVVGFLFIVASLVAGVVFYLTDIRASRLNPHFFFLLGKGKDKARKVEYDIRLAQGITRETAVGVKSEDYKVIYDKHIWWNKISKKALLLHKIGFGVGLTLIIVDIILYVFYV